jgi:hypothetical protein
MFSKKFPPHPVCISCIPQLSHCHHVMTFYILPYWHLTSWIQLILKQQHKVFCDFR